MRPCGRAERDVGIMHGIMHGRGVTQAWDQRSWERCQRAASPAAGRLQMARVRNVDCCVSEVHRFEPRSTVEAALAAAAFVRMCCGVAWTAVVTMSEGVMAPLQ